MTPSAVRLPERPHACLIRVGGEPGEGFGHSRRCRLADEPVLLIDNHLQRPACVPRRYYRLLEESLVRDEAEIFVDRCVEDSKTLGVEIDELAVVDPAREPDASIEPPLGR